MLTSGNFWGAPWSATDAKKKQNHCSEWRWHHSLSQGSLPRVIELTEWRHSHRPPLKKKWQRFVPPTSRLWSSDYFQTLSFGCWNSFTYIAVHRMIPEVSCRNIDLFWTVNCLYCIRGPLWCLYWSSFVRAQAQHNYLYFILVVRANFQALPASLLASNFYIKDVW